MTIQLTPKSEYQKQKVIRLAIEQLKSSYKELGDWLTTHMSQTGTENRLDVSGNPYNPNLWEEKLYQLESIEDELRAKNIRFLGVASGENIY